MLQNWTKYICTTWCILQAKFQKQTMPRCRQCVNSVPRRMSGAHAPRSGIPHMSWQGCEPARCVHRAASGSRRPGVANATTRTQIRARVGCRARMHALAGGVQMGWRGFLLPFCEPLQVCLAVVGIWRRTGGRRVYDRTQTVAAACNPLGDTPIGSHGRKEGTVAVPTRMLQMWVGSPNPHPRFRQSHSTVRLPCASSSRSRQPNLARMAVL